MWVVEVTAALSDVGDGEKVEWTDERASQRGVSGWGMKARATPGPAWQRGRGEHPAGSHGQEMKGPSDVVILSEERVTRLCRAGSKFTF